MEQLERDAAALPDDEEHEPRIVRWFWTAVLGVLAAAFAVAVYVVSFSKSVVTVLVFAAVASGGSALAVLATVVVTIVVQVVVSMAGVEPVARRWAVEL